MSTIQSASITIKNPPLKNPPLFTPTSVHLSTGSAQFEKSPTDSKKDANNKTQILIRDLCARKYFDRLILNPKALIIFPNGKKFTNKGNEPIIFHETKMCQNIQQQSLKA